MSFCFPPRVRNPSPMRIWVIDDEEAEHFLMRRVLRQIPCPIAPRILDSVACAQQALETAGADELPHLILCDLKMPGFDGFDFLRWLRLSRWRAIPVVIRSNCDLPSEVTRAYALGANAYHCKPSTLEELQARMEVLARYWLENCRLPSVGQQ
jgi:CheY-like chemotaxis protein